MSNTSAAASGTGKPPPRWVLKTMTRLHVLLHRLTGGGLNRIAGDEVCFVTMTGLLVFWHCWPAAARPTVPQRTTLLITTAPWP